MRAFGELPALRNSPEHLRRVLKRSGGSLVKTATLELENKARDLERVSRNLGNRLVGERTRNAQN